MRRTATREDVRQVAAQERVEKLCRDVFEVLKLRVRQVELLTELLESVVYREVHKELEERNLGLSIDGAKTAVWDVLAQVTGTKGLHKELTEKVSALKEVVGKL